MRYSYSLNTGSIFLSFTEGEIEAESVHDAHQLAEKIITENIRLAQAALNYHPSTANNDWEIMQQDLDDINITLIEPKVGNSYKVAKEFNDINDGIGWVTERWITEQLAHELTDERDQFTLMVLLANQGMLYKEDEITGDHATSDNKPPYEHQYTISEVFQEYGTMALKINQS